MGIDATTLRVAFGILALTLLLLFYFVTYLSTLSAFSLWWCRALSSFLGGAAAYLLDGTVHQVWANPLGNFLLVLGSGFVWAGARTLGGVPPSAWQLLIGPVITVVFSAFDNPATNDWSGGPVLLGSMCVLIALAARELYRLDRDYSRSRRPLLIVSATLAVYYLGRLFAFLGDGPRGPVFSTFFGTEVTTLITMVLLVVVSFSMAGLSSEQLARELDAGAARNRRDLTRGAQVQKNLLPKSSPDIDGYEVAGACVPSGRVSGDFFDWQHTEDGLTMTVGDVMGKGVGAAMIAATVRAALRVPIPAAGITETFSRVDSVLEADLVANEAFVTMFHARIRPSTGEVMVVDAGHGLAVIVRADGVLEILRSPNLPLGVQTDQEWVAQRYRLEPGDLLLAFSDGLLDLFDGTLESMLVAGASAAAAGSARAAVDHIQAMTSGVRLDDDVTVVALKRIH